MGKIVVLDISETGNQIGEKLFATLDPKQKKELIQYFLNGIAKAILIIPLSFPKITLHGIIKNSL